MLDIVLIILLLLGVIAGLKRGLILQLLHMIGFIASFIVAYMYYDKIAPKLTLWIPYPSMDVDHPIQMILKDIPFDEVFYRAIAFVGIFIATRIVLGILASALNVVASLPIIKIVNRFGGAILGFVEMYLFLFILLYIAALIPVEIVQKTMIDSSLVDGMLTKTPYFSEHIKEWWFGLTKS